MSGTTYFVNNSRLCTYSTADYAPILARYMGSVYIYVNMSYFGGWINGSNSASQGLIVGTTVSTSNVSLNNTQICVTTMGFYSWFSAGQITYNVSQTNQTLNINLTSYGYNIYNSTYGTYYYYALKPNGHSLNNTDINVTMSGAVTSSGYYYGIFGNFTFLFQTRMWGTQTETNYYTGVFLTNLSTALTTSCVQINITLQMGSTSTQHYLFGYCSTSSKFMNSYINITQTTSNYGQIYGLLYY